MYLPTQHKHKFAVLIKHRVHICTAHVVFDFMMTLLMNVWWLKLQRHMKPSLVVRLRTWRQWNRAELQHVLAFHLPYTFNMRRTLRRGGDFQTSLFWKSKLCILKFRQRLSLKQRYFCSAQLFYLSSFICCSYIVFISHINIMSCNITSPQQRTALILHRWTHER